MTRRSSLWRLALASFGLLVLAAVVPAQTPTFELRSANDSLIEDDTPRPTDLKHLPILFVHGHNFLPAIGEPNYKKNWQRQLARLGLTGENTLPSFRDALLLQRNHSLDIEDYYIHFLSQDGSIAQDAADVGRAVERILRRHDAGYTATNPTTVQVVIIAYSKGTISTRLYLKNLAAEIRSFNPVSEFIAISPPNHGLSLSSGGNSCPAQQLMNGMEANCDTFSTVQSCDPFPDDALGFFKALNGHPATNEERLDGPGDFPEEAPASRPDLRQDGTPTRTTEGTLYLTFYDSGNRDFVGGDLPSSDCRGRRFAKNLSPDAINLPTAVSGDSHNILFSDDDPIVVHQNTVHTPEVICQALYAAVHHRSPRGITCTNVELDLGSNESVLVPIIPKAAVMLALDFSGSMSARVCPDVTCATRAQVLKDAVELFVQLWLANGDQDERPGDRLGATYFRTQVSHFPTDGRLVLLDDSQTVTGNIGLQDPDDMTAMGGGLQQAIQVLKGLRARRPFSRVILFTDGLQNLNPMVQDINGQLVIDDQPGRDESNIEPTNPVTALNDSLGIAVDTIGIGAADAGLLQQIATATDGRARTTLDANLLNQFFTEQLIDTLRGSSPQLVAYRRGIVSSKSTSEAFAIEEGVRRVVLMVNWKRGNSLDFSVARNGVDVTGVGRFINGAFYKIFAMDLPARGSMAASANWEVRINGKPATSYEAAAIVDGGQIQYDANFDVRRPKSGDPLDLIVKLTAGGKVIPAAKVTVTLLSPTSSIGDLIARNPAKTFPANEPRMTAAERQLLALSLDTKRLAELKPKRETLILQPNDKGEFRAQIRPQVPGIYTATVSINGNDPRLGQFSRTQTVTTLVRFANPDAKLSDIFTTECADVGGRRYVRVVLSPRDTRGHFMGPGFPSEISLQLSAGRMVGKVRDLGDGGYMLLLELPLSGDPTIKLEVGSSQLFSGRLSQLSQKSPR